MIQSMKKNLGFDKMNQVSFTVPDGADAFLNTRELAQAGTITGSYFDGCSFEISAKADQGYEFDSWTVNGVNYYDEQMTVTPDMAVNGEIGIELNLRAFSGNNDIYISAIHSGKNGWIELYNPNSFTYSTESLYLSDDAKKLMKWKLPVINMPPESPITIVCKNNDSQDALLKAQTNFNLVGGEVLYLSDANGKILSYVDVVDMKNKEELRRQEDGSYLLSEVAAKADGN